MHSPSLTPRQPPSTPPIYPPPSTPPHLPSPIYPPPSTPTHLPPPIYPPPSPPHQVILRGPPWWLRLPLLLAFFGGSVYRSLPPAPEGDFEVRVRPGLTHGSRIVYAREPREVVFVIRQWPPGARLALATLMRKAGVPVGLPGLQRRRHDLVAVRRISNRAARKGCVIRVPQLEGPPLEVTLEPGEVNSSSCTKRLEGEGMPIKGGPARGDLEIQFVLWP